MENAGNGAQFGPGGGANGDVNVADDPPQVPEGGAAHGIGAGPINGPQGEQAANGNGIGAGPINGPQGEQAANGNGIGAGPINGPQGEQAANGNGIGAGPINGPQVIVEDEPEGDQVMAMVPNQFVLNNLEIARLIAMIRAGGAMISHHADQLTAIGLTIGNNANILAENHMVEDFNQTVNQIMGNFELMGWVVESIFVITPQINNTAIHLAQVNAANAAFNAAFIPAIVHINANVPAANAAHAQGNVVVGQQDVNDMQNVEGQNQLAEQNQQEIGQAEQQVNNNNNLEQMIADGIAVIAQAAATVVNEAAQIAHIGLSLDIIADLMDGNRAFIYTAVAHTVEQMVQGNEIAQRMIDVSDQIIHVAVTIAGVNALVQGVAENQENAEGEGPLHENDAVEEHMPGENEAIMQAEGQAHMQVQGVDIHPEQGLPDAPVEGYGPDEEDHGLMRRIMLTEYCGSYGWDETRTLADQEGRLFQHYASVSRV